MIVLLLLLLLLLLSCENILNYFHKNDTLDRFCLTERDGVTHRLSRLVKHRQTAVCCKCCRCLTDDPSAVFLVLLHRLLFSRVCTAYLS